MYKKILVAVDFDTPNITEKLCKSAAKMAVNTNAKIELFSVMPDYGTPLVATFFSEGAQDRLKTEFARKLNTLSRQYFKNQSITLSLKQGKVASTTLHYIDKAKPDLVMIGCRKKRSRGNLRLLGSSSFAIADRTKCSVLVVR